MQVFFFKYLGILKCLLIFVHSAVECDYPKKKLKKKWICEYFSREEISEIMRVLFSREKNLKCEYFSEHPKFSEDFGREHFKILVTKKRVNRSFSTLEKARKKKPMRGPWPVLVKKLQLITDQLQFFYLCFFGDQLQFFYFQRISADLRFTFFRTVLRKICSNIWSSITRTKV